MVNYFVTIPDPLSESVFEATYISKALYQTSHSDREMAH
jgi:hypothetical protein